MKLRLRGQATLVRYADDFVIGFEYKDDAKRVMDALGRRMEHFGLTLHPDKTRLLPFRRPPKRREGGKGRATFDFVGFTFQWARTKKGCWAMFCKTRSASLRRIIESVYDWCRRNRHQSVKEQHAASSIRSSTSSLRLVGTGSSESRNWYRATGVESSTRTSTGDHGSENA